MLKLFSLALTLALNMCAPAFADMTREELVNVNTYIDQTNFQIENHCSATLVSKDYQLLLTNYHCIAKYVTFPITIETLPNGEERSVTNETWRGFRVHQFYKDAEFSYDTQIVAYDKSNDLAVLQLNAGRHWINSLIPLEAHVLDSTEQLLRGETVYAVGNPNMQFATLHKGLLSYVNRILETPAGSQRLLQVDVGISPGSSGGALYNEDWKLIGVTSGGFPMTAIGFAVPYDIINNLFDVVCDMNHYDKWYACQ